MADADDQWIHFSSKQAKRKRAEAVCVPCHARKVKCDLASRSQQGLKDCSNCLSTGRSCLLRSSKRGKKRLTDATTADYSATQVQDAGLQADADASHLLGHFTLSPIVNGAPGLPLSTSDERMNTRSRALNDHAASSPAGRGYTTRPVRPAVHHAISPPGDGSIHSANPGVTASPALQTGESHAGDVDTGYLQVYGPENSLDAQEQELQACLEAQTTTADPGQQELLQTFAETYWEFCYAWCPVLDPSTLSGDMNRSALLANAVALVGSNVQPPLLPHEGSAAYYDRARRLFYDDEEANVLTSLKAISLFYWWAPRPPSTAHRHSSWWWTSVIIRHAQQMGIHRQPAENDPYRAQVDLSLRRRIWWTAFVSPASATHTPYQGGYLDFLKSLCRTAEGSSDIFEGTASLTISSQARERLTALCQSKPCIIDPADCSIHPPQLSDFPSSPSFQRKGLIFIHWVRLCDIIGHAAKALSRSSATSTFDRSNSLHHDLLHWVQSLPSELQLRIGQSRTEAFDRDVHQLHLPYLTTIIILHLQRSPHDLPQALPPAFLAASCIARIYRDILSRGNARFLMAINCWYSGTAFIALLQATQIPQFTREAEDGLQILVHTAEQLEKMWGSAKVIRQGFERMLKTRQGAAVNLMAPNGRPGVSTASAHHHITAHSNGISRDDNTRNDFDWTALFPFVTRSTSHIAECLLTDKEQGTITRGMPSPDNMLFYESMIDQYNDFLEPFMDNTLDFSDLMFPG